jgi:hypothetical protein
MARECGFSINSIAELSFGRIPELYWASGSYLLFFESLLLKELAVDLNAWDIKKPRNSEAPRACLNQ